jgi:hypothetical protein
MSVVVQDGGKGRNKRIATRLGDGLGVIVIVVGVGIGGRGIAFRRPRRLILGLAIGGQHIIDQARHLDRFLDAVVALEGEDRGESRLEPRRDA